MATVVDFDALRASDGPHVALISNTSVYPGLVSDVFSDFSVFDSVYIYAKAQLTGAQRGSALLTLTVEHSDDGLSWSTAETLTTTYDGTPAGRIDSPKAYLRVSVSARCEWQLFYVNASPNASGGGGGGTVTSVSAADTSIVVANGTTTPTIRTGTLDAIATAHPPVASVALNSQKITGLADGTANSHAATVGQLPVGVPIETFGVVVDGRQLTGISVTGTAMSASSAMFTSADVGKTVAVKKADGWYGQAVISAYTDTTHVTLGTSISTASNKLAVIGTDNTTAVQSILNDSRVLTGGLRVVYGGSGGICLIAGPQVTGTVTATGDAAGLVYSYSGQLLFPANPLANAVGLVEFTGTVAPGASVLGFNADAVSGLIILSTATSGYVFDVIPDPLGFGGIVGYGGAGAFSFIHANFRRMVIRTGWDSTGAGPGGARLLALANATFDEFVIDVYGAPVNSPPTGGGLTPPPSTGESSNAGCAVIMPGSTNWGRVDFRRGWVSGYPKGISHSEHAHIDDVLIDTCGTGLAPGDLPALTRQAAGHPAFYQNVCVQRVNTVVEPISSFGVRGSLQVEGVNTTFLNDTHGYLFGDLLVGAPGSLASTGLYVTSAGTGLRLRSDHNPVQPEQFAPVVDTLKRVGGIAGAFGIADGSNHLWYPLRMANDADGAYVSSSSSFAFAYGATQFRSRKVTATLTSSPTAGRTWAGIALRGEGVLYDGLYLIFSNNASGTGVYLFKTTSYTQLAHTAFTIAASTSYTIDVLAQQSSEPGGRIVIRVFVGGVEVGGEFPYMLTAADTATYVSSRLDGITSHKASTTDDGGSRIHDITITRAEDLPYVFYGTATLVGGTVDVANTAITTASKVKVWRLATGGTLGHLSVALTASTKFTVNSSSATDTSTVYYEVTSY